MVLKAFWALDVDPSPGWTFIDLRPDSRFRRFVRFPCALQPIARLDLANPCFTGVYRPAVFALLAEERLNTE